jgi:hypothetical protein
MKKASIISLQIFISSITVCIFLIAYELLLKSKANNNLSTKLLPEYPGSGHADYFRETQEKLTFLKFQIDSLRNELKGLQANRNENGLSKQSLFSNNDIVYDNSRREKRTSSQPAELALQSDPSKSWIVNQQVEEINKFVHLDDDKKSLLKKKLGEKVLNNELDEVEVKKALEDAAGQEVYNLYIQGREAEENHTRQKNAESNLAILSSKLRLSEEQKSAVYELLLSSDNETNKERSNLQSKINSLMADHFKEKKEDTSSVERRPALTQDSFEEIQKLEQAVNDKRAQILGSKMKDLLSKGVLTEEQYSTFLNNNDLIK